VDVQYDDTLSKPCAELASRWSAAKEDESKLDEFSSKDMEDFITQQKGKLAVHFIRTRSRLC
jgi:leukotriene-A4 hydrolase